MKIIDYKRELIKKLLDKYEESTVEIVFNEKDITLEENKLISDMAIDLDYTMFKKDFWDLVGENNTRIEIKADEAIKLLNKIIDKLKLFDFMIVGKKVILIFNHENKIGIVEK